MGKSKRPAKPRPVCVGCTLPIEVGELMTSTFVGEDNATERRWHFRCFEDRQLPLPGYEPPTMTPVGDAHALLKHGAGGDR